MGFAEIDINWKTVHQHHTLLWGSSCEPQILRRHQFVLKHEPQSRHRISIDPRLFDLDAIRPTFVLDVPELECCFHDSAPFLALVVRKCAFNVFEPDVSLRVAKHGPTITIFPVVCVSNDTLRSAAEYLPADQERRLMFLATSERAIDLAQDVIGLVGAFAPGAIALLKREVRRVPHVGINTTRPGSGIDLLSCVAFHPLHGWVLAGLLVPVTTMNKCLLGF